MRIGICTGGGDVPGLNPCIKAVVGRVADAGHEVVGIRRGWAGLLETDPDDAASVQANTVALDPPTVRTINRTGGTILHTSRTNPGRVKTAGVPPFLADRVTGDGPHDLTDHVLHVLDRLGLDALIPIGGDDTLSYGLRLHDEGVPVIAIPKTMDNDVHGTDYCIGFSTAVTRGVEFIHALRTSTGSHERIAVVELFGRYSGETSLITAYLAGADRAVISEVPFDVERLAAFLVEDKRRNPSNYSMVTISEGATIDRRGDDAVGRRRRLRASQAGRDRGRDRRADRADHRRGDRAAARRLPDALGQPGLPRPDGRHELRRDGGRPRARRGLGAHGGPARRDVHQRADQRDA